MELWKIIFLSKWVICRFKLLIFQGELSSSCGIISNDETYITKVSEIDSEVVGRQEGTAPRSSHDCWNPGTNEVKS